MSITTPSGEPKTAAGAAPTAKNAGFIAICFLGVLAAVQGTDPQIASSALLKAAAELHMGSLNALAASVSTLMLAATVISTGILADRLGRRRVLIAALLAAIVGDVIVALAPNAWIFILGRALAGIGLGAVFGASFAYVRHFAQGRAGGLPAALGLYTAVVGGVTVLLTFVGSSLVGVDWRISFLLIPIVSAISIVLAFAVLPRDEHTVTDAPADVFGQLLLAFGIIAALFGISNAANSITAPLTLIPFILGVLLLTAWAWWEARNPERKFFPVRLFTQPVFLAAVVAGMLYNLISGSVFLAFSNTFQYSLDLTGMEMSLSQLPYLLMTIPVGLYIGKLLGSGKLSRRGVLVLGAGVLAIGAVWFAIVAFSHPSSVWPYLPPLLIMGGGVVIPSLPYASMILEAADDRHFGAVSSSRTTIGQFWYALGLALSTIVLDALTRSHVSGALGADAVTQLDAYAATGAKPANSQVLHDAAIGYSTAFGWLMLGIAVVAVIGGIIAWALLSVRTAASTDNAPEHP